MAKQLLLIRHAKSDWNNAGLKDFDRPLNKRGNSNAPEMAQRMFKKGIIPNLLVSSPALRALTTAKHFASTLQIPSEKLQKESTIYEANVKSLLNVVNDLDDQADFVALFGHNPGLTDFANYLSNSNIYNMPTCSMVMIAFSCENWSEVSADTGEIVFFDYPKNGDD
jgi:phosphohistidine phosphatase